MHPCDRWCQGLPRIGGMWSSLPKLSNMLHRPMAWLEAAQTVADLLDLSLRLLHKCDNINNTQKHKMHPKLPLRAVTRKLPQSSHLEHFWRQKRWVAGEFDLEHCHMQALTLHCKHNWCGFGNIIFCMTDILVIFVTEKSYDAFTEILTNFQRK